MNGRERKGDGIGRVIQVMAPRADSPMPTDARGGRPAARRPLRKRPCVQVAAVVAALALAALPAVATAAPGDISTAAGTGVGGFAGDGGQAAAARVNGPRGVDWMPDGGFVFADYDNSRVRRVLTSGVIATVAGTGVNGYNGDGIDATSAQLNSVHGVAALADGRILIDDKSNQRIRRIELDGKLTTVAGTGTEGFSGDLGSATAARINDPRGIASMPDGGFLIADSDNHRVRYVSPTGTIRTVAGTGTAGFSGDGGQATAARLNLPFGVAATGDGGFLIADNGNNRIRRVDPGGAITTIAGNGTAGSGGDGGPALAASMRPTAVDASPDGGFLVADNMANRVRYVSPAGVVTTAAGTGAASSGGDGGPATGAGVFGPRGVAARADGDFLIAEFDGDRVRQVDFVAPPDSTPPAPPTGLSASAGDGSVSLDWADNAEGDLEGYDVYRSTTAGGGYSKVNGPRLSASAYTDSGVTNGTTYYYVVRAVDRSGNPSGDSNEAQATPAGSAYRQAVLGTAGLLSYWRLGEGSGSTAADSKGARNGTYFGPALRQPGALAGDPDTSAGFDGIDDYVRVLDFSPPASLSLEAWIYPKDTSTGTDRVVLDKSNGEYDLRIGEDGNLRFITGSPIQTAVDDSFNFHTSNNANRWYHIVATFDSSADSVRFYRDGALTKTVTGFTAAIQNTSFALRIGRHSQYGGVPAFNGRIDEVALYDRVLSGTTVQEHYEAGGP
jgi:concanavalin A-like lectin/glucanase superfamily protein/fibronectin type III domain protein/NHL repeat-containing protein